MLQHVSVCLLAEETELKDSILQHVAVCCSMLQYVAVCLLAEETELKDSVLHMLQCVAVFCGSLQSVF